MEGETSEITEISQVQSESDSSEVKVLDVIPVQLVDDDSYQTLRTIENSQRSKYYKQTYRRAWEQMPDFAGWLTGVENEPTRAYCIYCQKTLHAHRLSLLKHTCTIRHQKAAQLHRIRMIKPTKGQHVKEETAATDENAYQEEEDDEMVEYSEVIEEGDERTDNEIYQLEEEGTEDTEEIHLDQDSTQTATNFQTMPPISTHVIDSVRGCPVSGLAISLYKLIEGKWTYINEGFTNHDGRFSKFVEGSNFSSGRYKLHYDVDKYFESRKQSSLYPFIEVRVLKVVQEQNWNGRLSFGDKFHQIVFDCKVFNTNYHIPLILSPNGYSTYKGTL